MHSRSKAKAEEETDKLQTWGALYQSYRRHADCDDGAVAEGYDEVVARLLRDHWDPLPQFAVLFEKDQRFKTFVLRHVSLTSLDTNDLKKKLEPMLWSIVQLGRTTSARICVAESRTIFHNSGKTSP